MVSRVEVRFAETRWDQVDPPRPLTAWERHVLDLLLFKPFPGNDDLRRQAETARVSAVCTCCLSIALTDADSAPRPPSNTHHGHVDMEMVAELDGIDTDSVPFWALLFVRNGLLAELEIQRADGTPFMDEPTFERHQAIEGGGAR